MGLVEQRLSAYLALMQAHGRLLTFQEDGKATGWLTFFIVRSLEEAAQFHARGLWSVALDFPEGAVGYIDKLLLASPWNREMRDGVVNSLKQAHPKLETLVWYRPTRDTDRRVVWPITQRSSYAQV